MINKRYNLQSEKKTTFFKTAPKPFAAAYRPSETGSGAVLHKSGPTLGT